MDKIAYRKSIATKSKPLILNLTAKRALRAARKGVMNLQKITGTEAKNEENTLSKRYHYKTNTGHEV